MKYISGLFGLNLACKLETMGDWHCSALNWDNPLILESDDSVFKKFGIETNKKIPEHYQLYNVANHIRSCLDLIDRGEFAKVEGMARDFLYTKDDKYIKLIFNKILLLKNSSNWQQINNFMLKEYDLKWLNFNKSENKTIIKSSIHIEIIDLFIGYLYSKTNLFILKDTISLIKCYKFNRYVNLIKLDAPIDKNNMINEIVENFCFNNNINYKVIKKTKSLGCYELINHINPLKIEISFKKIDYDNVIYLNNITSYDINTLAISKNNSFQVYNKIDDLIELIFIIKNYWDILDKSVKNIICDSFSYKGINYFMMMFNMQKEYNDELINDFFNILINLI